MYTISAEPDSITARLTHRLLLEYWLKAIVAAAALVRLSACQTCYIGREEQSSAVKYISAAFGLLAVLQWLTPRVVEASSGVAGYLHWAREPVSWTRLGSLGSHSQPDTRDQVQRSVHPATRLL